jgi:hypothetical protein
MAANHNHAEQLHRGSLVAMLCGISIPSTKKMHSSEIATSQRRREQPPKGWSQGIATSLQPKQTQEKAHLQPGIKINAMAAAASNQA